MSRLPDVTRWWTVGSPKVVLSDAREFQFPPVSRNKDDVRVVLFGDISTLNTDREIVRQQTGQYIEMDLEWSVDIGMPDGSSTIIEAIADIYNALIADGLTAEFYRDSTATDHFEVVPMPNAVLTLQDDGGFFRGVHLQLVSKNLWEPPTIDVGESYSYSYVDAPLCVGSGAGFMETL